jgi:hypothetical protein
MFEPTEKSEYVLLLENLTATLSHFSHDDQARWEELQSVVTDVEDETIGIG